MKVALPAVLAAIVLGACSAEKGPQALQGHPVSERSSPAPIASMNSPKPLEFRANISIQRYPDWDTAVLSQAPVDQEVLREVRSRLGDVAVFHSQQEQAELMRMGFPMPEEWLAASRMPDDELKRLADTGNTKAQMFHADRLSRRLAALQHARSNNALPSGITEQQLVAMTGESLAAAAKLMRSTRSPFAAYLYGHALSAAAPNTPKEPIVAACFAARDRGDVRANALMNALTAPHPSLNMQIVMATYSTMKSLGP